MDKKDVNDPRECVCGRSKKPQDKLCSFCRQPKPTGIFALSRFSFALTHSLTLRKQPVSTIISIRASMRLALIFLLILLFFLNSLAILCNFGIIIHKSKDMIKTSRRNNFYFSFYFTSSGRSFLCGVLTKQQKNKHHQGKQQNDLLSREVVLYIINSLKYE